MSELVTSPRFWGRKMVGVAGLFVLGGCPAEPSEPAAAGQVHRATEAPVAIESPPQIDADDFQPPSTTERSQRFRESQPPVSLRDVSIHGQHATCDSDLAIALGHPCDEPAAPDGVRHNADVRAVDLDRLQAGEAPRQGSLSWSGAGSSVGSRPEDLPNGR